LADDISRRQGLRFGDKALICPVKAASTNTGLPTVAKPSPPTITDENGIKITSRLGSSLLFCLRLMTPLYGHPIIKDGIEVGRGLPRKPYGN